MIIVALGPHVAEWTALQKRLQALRLATDAHLVAVISTGNVLWCASRTEADVDTYADQFYRASIAPRRVDLKRGARLDVVQRVADDAVQVARSFAGIYVLVLWFKVKTSAIVASRFVFEGFDEASVRNAITKALPQIEALTLSLPPPDPEPAEGAGKARA